MNILITGGTSGLGLAISKILLADSSNNIYATYYSSKDLAIKMETDYPNFTACLCDITNENSRTTLAIKIQEWDIDVLINNAFTGFEKKHFHKLSAEYLLANFQANTLSTVLITQATIKYFRKKKYGKIITILSAALINKPPIGWSEYVASKAYLLSMSKSWATEYIKYNISSNCVSPSFMLTNLNQDTDERIIELMKQQHPLKEILTIEQVGESVKFLTMAPQHLNGINLIINAGENVI